MFKGKWWVLIVGTMVFLALNFNLAYAQRDNVHISEQNWTGSTVICQVMKYVLEKKLNIPVKISVLNGAATWTAIEKGDVDVFSDIWETAEIEGMKKFAQEKKVAELTLSYPKAPQGWFIPKYVQAKHGLKSIADLKGKEKLFDIDGDGKGDIWVGPTSWKANEIHRIRIRDYGLEFNAVGVEQFAWLATLKEAYRKQQPIIFYYWEPEWLFTQYDLVMIEEPPYEASKWVYVEKHPEKSKITCGMEPSDVWVGFAVKLKDRLPKAYQFFKNWSIPIKEVDNLVALVTDLPGQSKVTPAEAAQKWVESHPDIVKAWLKGIK
ncbi:MAG: glycine betaine ABC transporter substrate-binding protein [Thermodesulfobacteriota bacterium]